MYLFAGDDKYVNRKILNYYIQRNINMDFFLEWTGTLENVLLYSMCGFRLRKYCNGEQLRLALCNR